MLRGRRSMENRDGTVERSGRSYKRSLLSAISEINANSETQFDPHVVDVFNEVKRRLIAKQA